MPGDIIQILKMKEKNKLLDLARSPLKFQLFLLSKIPAAFLSGIKIKEISLEKCVTSVPFRWLTQNPFHSTYFASLAMAAEMSTGILALLGTSDKVAAISMLVTKMEANYFKKPGKLPSLRVGRVGKLLLL